MPAHIFCGLLKGGLGSCMAIGRNLECRTKRSPEPAHFRNVGHHFSLFDAAPHLFEEGIRLLHLLSQGNERGDPDWFSMIHRFQSLLGDQICSTNSLAISWLSLARLI